MGRGRKELQGKLDGDRLEQAMGRAEISYRKLGKDPTVDVNERTIRRARDTGRIEPCLLNRLAKRLNVSPAWLSNDMPESLLEYLKENYPEVYERLTDIEKNPYAVELAVCVDQGDWLKNTLALSDIPYEQFLALSDQEQCDYRIQLDALIKILNLTFFKSKQDGHPYYLTHERMEKAAAFMNSTTSDEIFKIIP